VEVTVTATNFLPFGIFTCCWNVWGIKGI
jgi:hypothetical protein